jgi:hypothetical protein
VTDLFFIFACFGISFGCVLVERI